MENPIQISKINDFLFCPYSIYLHSIYNSFTDNTFKQKPQIRGKAEHTNIDQSKYSTSNNYLQGIPIYSHRYNIIGKIDIYDKKNKALIDRKYKISEIFTGYKYQLYAQYLCMIDKGYEIKKLLLHSLKDNKRYNIGIPNKTDLTHFTKLIQQIKDFDLEENPTIKVNNKKCTNCIYSTLCHHAELT